MGGVSMESSAETGLKAGQLILNKYQIASRSNLPIEHTNQYLTKLTLPLILFDQLLYKYQFRPLTDYISPIILMTIYFILLFLIVVFLIIFAIQLTPQIFEVFKNVNFQTVQK
jgi:hypothetical protein